MDRSWRDWLKLAVIAAGWLGLGLFSVRNLLFHLPAPVAAWLTEPSYFSLVWLSVTALGIGASFALLERPREDLVLVRPTLGAMVLALLVAPIVLALSLYLAWKIAFPTIVDELSTRGTQAVRASVSSANRAARQGSLTTIALWTIAITPVAEELVFRGAIWSTLARLTQRFAEPKAHSLPPELINSGGGADALAGLWRFLATGGLATFATAALFAWLHLEGTGGAAMIAATQTVCLGITLGMARHASGSIAAPILIHAVFNGLTLVSKREWQQAPKWPFVEVAGLSKPLPMQIPVPLWQTAAVCAALALIGCAARALLRRRATARTLR